MLLLIYNNTYMIINYGSIMETSCIALSSPRLFFHDNRVILSDLCTG